ncbi:GerMN domain-containing protein [Treponema sp.]|uniref:GerMN domain-containing protein n=1 Tax=Treponema sp. TaxID=166 RepID=UPI0025EB6144|nr:GerMN domain-containing protein [Treponema sp.]MCR5217418.1 GerMN domain-containing protein [Treponema sp.]
MKNDDKRKKKNTGASLAVWIVISLFLLIVFIVYSPKIKKNISEAKESIALQEPEVLPPESLETDNQVAEAETVHIDLHDNAAENKNTSSEKEESAAETKEASDEKENKAQEEKTQDQTKKDQSQNKESSADNAENKSSEKNSPAKNDSKKQTSTAEKKTSTINTQLCFMTVSSNGTILRKQVTRKVSKDSPLKDAINALLAGPTAAEENSQCQSFISNGTRLLGLSISNGVAVLNFSEEFEFNQYGIEGIRCQLQQIVYTATAFSTVNSVQFLIEGEKRQFVNSESSCYIGSPLSRNSF